MMWKYEHIKHCISRCCVLATISECVGEKGGNIIGMFIVYSAYPWFTTHKHTHTHTRKHERMFGFFSGFEWIEKICCCISACSLRVFHRNSAINLGKVTINFSSNFALSRWHNDGHCVSISAFIKHIFHVWKKKKKELFSFSDLIYQTLMEVNSNRQASKQ